MTIEEALARLEEINRALTLGEVTVNEAVELYKEAALLLARCDKMIKTAREELALASGGIDGGEDENI